MTRNNTFVGNTITNNYRGIYVGFQSSGNIFYHNNILANQYYQVYQENHIQQRPYNKWDNGYPCGGNYWGDYAGVDSDNDGIGDTPYVINANNRDNYPLMALWSPVEVPFWMQWWFWTIIAAGIIVLVGAVYFLKKKKPPTPTAPLLPQENTLSD